MASLIEGSVNPANFTINGRSNKYPDIQKNFMWQMFIPGITSVASSAILDAEDLLVRCRSIAIPERTTEAIQSNFMGTQQYFPGRVTPGGVVTAEFEETEDMAISQIFYEWQQNIFNINPASPTGAGKSARPLKRLLAKDIYLLLFSYNGIPLAKSVRFHNAWVQAVSEVPLNYEGSEAIRYSVSFQYDFWTLFPDTTVI